MLKIRDVSFAFPARTNGTLLPVVAGLSMEVEEGNIAALVGPSGCGKTTILNLVAGLLQPSRGIIDLPRESDQRTRAAYVFQSPSLLPWLRVRDNALFGASIVGPVTDEITARCDVLLDRYGLGGFERAYPAALSGGMQQRVAIVRAVLSGAKVMLLDEPFSNSDFLLRMQLQRELSRLVEEDDLIALIVTHDVEEAVRIAEKVIVLTQRPTRVKAEIAIPVPRSDRLSQDSSSLRAISPYLERVWDALKAIDPPAGVNQGATA